jgi:hypothetical protein
MDLLPYSTRYPELWEKVFALYLNEYEREKRRDILDALWKIISANQAPQFIELVLQKINPDVKVFDNIPLSDPRNKKAVGVSVCGFETMMCGHGYACCGYMMGNENYDPYVLRNNIEKVYDIPDDERFWETCFFVCKQLYRSSSQNILFIEPIEISITWKSLIEFLILKIKPVHTTAVLYIKFIGMENDDTY